MESIKIEIPLRIIWIELSGSYLTSVRHRCGFCSVAENYFNNWVELVPQHWTSTKPVFTASINNFISEFGTPLEIVFIMDAFSEIFTDLCHRLKIEHIITVPYGPQVNLEEKVNKSLAQLIFSYFGWYHGYYDRYLKQFE